MPVFLSISIALLPRAPSDFYLLHTFAEEFTSVVCDPSHRVPHPLIKDCATDVPSPMWIRLFFAPQWCWQPWPPSDLRATKRRLENGPRSSLFQSLLDNRGLITVACDYLSRRYSPHIRRYSFAKSLPKRKRNWKLCWKFYISELNTGVTGLNLETL